MISLEITDVIMVSLAANESKARALPFISVDEAGEFVIDPEARKCLEEITCSSGWHCDSTVLANLTF